MWKNLEVIQGKETRVFLQVKPVELVTVLLLAMPVLNNSIRLTSPQTVITVKDVAVISSTISTSITFIIMSVITVKKQTNNRFLKYHSHNHRSLFAAIVSIPNYTVISHVRS